VDKRVEQKIKKYNQIKMDLLNVSKCIDCCSSINEKEVYQNIALKYSEEMKQIKDLLEKIYDVKICSCCRL